MGALIYGIAPAIEMEDRVLRHIQVVMIQKLRRNESFAFNWDEQPGVAGDTEHENGAHGTIWISNASQLYFRYDGARHKHELNPFWIDALMKATYKADGLSVLPEPQTTDANGETMHIAQEQATR
jgi:hypothetical protein